MNRRSTTFLIAACVSVGLHAAMFSTFPHYRVGGGEPEWPGREPRRVEVMTLALEPEPRAEPEEPTADADSPAEADSEADAATEPKLEPEPEPEKTPPPEFEMGASDGKGFASHDVPGEVEATAPEADADQAPLSLDPVGQGERGRGETSSRTTGEGAAAGQTGSGRGGSPPPPPTVVLVTPAVPKSLKPFGLSPVSKMPQARPNAKPAPPPTAPPPSAPSVVGPASPATPAVIARVDRSPAAVQRVDRSPAVPREPPPAPPPAKAVREPVPPKPAVEVVLPPVAAAVPPLSLTPVPPRPPVAAEAPGGGGSARPRGSQGPAADPAPQSDSESDPFSRLGTVVVRDGRLDIRFGRKVRTRRPKLLLAGEVDLLTLRRARIVLKIAIDETGKVQTVDVVKSSGSNEIDQPTRLAVYDWWFEPKKDASGKAIPDEVQFTIGWR